MELEKDIRVLVVDDDETVCRHAASILSDLNVKVERAQATREALEKLETSRERYGVAIVDFAVPHFNGIRLLKIIKMRHPSLPVIVTTNHTTIEEAVECMRLGAFDYITKPIKPEILVDATKRAIRIFETAGQTNSVDTNEQGSEKSAPIERPPGSEVQSPMSREYCPKGQRRCLRYVKLGICEGECPLLLKEEREKASSVVDDLLRAAHARDVIDVDMPFNLAEVIRATSPVYVDSLSMSEIPVPEGIPVAETSPGRILVVEPDTETIKEIGSILQKRGFEVDEESSPPDVFDRLRNASYDVVLFEISKSGSDGMDLLKGIKDRFPDVKVILLDRNASLEAAIAYLRSGARDYIPHPFSSSEILAAIERARD